MNRQDILSNLNNPKELEKLFRNNKAAFKSAFNEIYPELSGNQIAEYWNERLNYENGDISWGSKSELVLVILVALVAGTIAKLPAIFQIDEEFFYPRNIGFIVFPILSAYFIWRKGISTKKTILAGSAFLISVVFINLLPETYSDTLILSCIHLPIFLWAVFGFIFTADDAKSYQNRLNFLRFNGDLVIMTTLILLAGGILTGITIGLFSVIDIQIEEFYFEYFGIFGLAAAPVVASYITQTNPQLVNKVSPVIAKIFSPLVLITLIVYLVAIFYSGKNPYEDREFLLIFNLLLIGVMAIIFFSVAETSRQTSNRGGHYILFALSVVTIIVNGIALSAILFRISEWGFTPNRLAILGGNVFMLTNLLMITYRLFIVAFKKGEIRGVENSISRFLPVYIIWTIAVTFIFPLIFNFR